MPENISKEKFFTFFIFLILIILNIFLFGVHGVRAATYESTFTSQVFDNYHSSVDYGTFSWVASVPANTSLVFSVHAGNTAVPDGSWTTWLTIASSPASLNAYDGKRYFQYKVVLGTNVLTATPTINSVSITTNTSALTSSVFDSENSQNIIKAISWNETLPGASNVVLQIRTSPDNAAWSNWCGPDDGGAGCNTESWFTDPSGGEKTDAMFSDQIDDEYFQYRIIFIYDVAGGNVPIVDNVSIRDYYMLTYSAGPNGSVVGISPQSIKPGVSASTVTAIPNTNYHFIDWSDGSTVNPRIDANITDDISVTANFAIDTFVVEYPAGDNGTIIGDPFQTIEYGADSAPITAVPNAGYHFVGWSDGSTDNPRIFYNIRAKSLVVPNFVLDTVNTGSPDLDTDVTGYAWNSNVGWISLNCSNNASCAASQYGVRIDPATGNFSGHAWNQIIGWIEFAPAADLVNYPVCGYPDSVCHSAKLESDGNVTGWAKISSLGDDGWIKMSGDSWTNGVKIDSVTGDFSGFAWNSDGYSGIGWVSFNCSNTASCATSNYLAHYEKPVPDAPSNLSVQTLSCSEVKLSWTDNSDDETGFQGQYDDGTGYQSLLSCDTGTNINYCTINMPFNSNWKFQVKAYNAYGDSAWSNEATGVTSYCAPTGLTINSSDCAGVSLSWTQIGTGVDHYEVHRSIDSGAFQLLQDDISPSLFNYVDTNIEEDKKYGYKVVAQANGYESGVVEVIPCHGLQWWREVK